MFEKVVEHPQRLGMQHLLPGGLRFELVQGLFEGGDADAPSTGVMPRRWRGQAYLMVCRV